MILAAGPWIGEFGHELFAWQSYIRAVSKSYSKTVVACRPGHEVLYEDFASQVVPYAAPVTTCICNSNVGNGIAEISHADIFRGVPYATLLPGTTRFRDTGKPQEFKKYGTGSGPAYDVVIHARNITVAAEDIAYRGRLAASESALKTSRNWELDKWEAFVGVILSAGYKVACIGMSDAALAFEGTDDMRDIDLRQTTELLSASKLIVGPSSGPMHLATLCGTPQVIWGIPSLDARYKKAWNPFNTPVYFHTVDVKWDPEADTIIGMTLDALSAQ